MREEWCAICWSGLEALVSILWPATTTSSPSPRPPLLPLTHSHTTLPFPSQHGPKEACRPSWSISDPSSPGTGTCEWNGWQLVCMELKGCVVSGVGTGFAKEKSFLSKFEVWVMARVTWIWPPWGLPVMSWLSYLSKPTIRFLVSLCELNNTKTYIRLYAFNLCLLETVSLSNSLSLTDMDKELCLVNM